MIRLHPSFIYLLYTLFSGYLINNYNKPKISSFQGISKGCLELNYLLKL